MQRVRVALLFAVAVILLALPASALATSPFAGTNDPTITGATTATFSGNVDPGGEATPAIFKYDLASSTFCTDEDASAAAANQTPDQSLTADQGGFDGADVAAEVTGLTKGVPYCVVLVASNTSGASDGGFTTFLAGAPSAETDDVNRTGQSTATIFGSVNPAGQTTTYHAEYALASSTWCTSDGQSGSPSNTAPQMLGFMDTDFHSVGVDLTGLTGGSQYCAEL